MSVRSLSHLLLFLLVTDCCATKLLADSCGEKPVAGSPAQLAYVQCSIAKSNWNEAVEQLRSYRARVPDSLDAALVEVDLLIETHQMENAQQVLDPLLREHPKSVPVLTLYAELCEKLGRWAEAEPWLRKATELTPRDPAVWKRLADLYVAKRQKTPSDAFKRQSRSPPAMP